MSTQNYTYSGDRMNGTTYDEIGNPLTYNGYDMTWQGRCLMEMSMLGGQFVNSFKYNDQDIRTEKTVNGVKHTYALNGTQIVSEAYDNKLLVYLYDESGLPIGMQYRTTSYAAYEYDNFWFEKNLQGDIIAVYNDNGEKIGSYKYDAWGNVTVAVESGTSMLEKHIVRSLNPFRYRGYYYDTDTGLYYLQSRYYDPQMGRFINADGADVLTATPDGLTDKNLYLYCDNNPVMRTDEDGEFWNILIGATVGFAVGVGISIVTQFMAGELDFTSPKTWAKIGISALSGTITGGLAASGVPLSGQIIANTVCGMLSSVADTGIDHMAGETKSFSDYALLIRQKNNH